MKIYRVGLLGFGFIGKVHAYGHRNIPLFYDQQEFGSVITGVCTSRPATARQAAARLGGVRPVDDYRSLIDDAAIDIIDRCTPIDCHAAAVLAAMAAGKHIYCDKPLCATPAEARRIEAALPSYRGIAQMTLQNRFFPSTLRAKELIDAGEIGDILEFRASYLHGGSADPHAPFKWKLAAGTAADLGSHILDLMHHLLGDFTELSAVTHIAYPFRPMAGDPSRLVPVTAEDNMLVTLQLPNGAGGTISASKIATGAEDEVSFEIYGSKGALKLQPMNFDKLFFYSTAAPASPLGGKRGWTAIDCGQRYPEPAGFPTPKAAIGWLRGHLHCLYTFLESVHRRQALGPDLRQGLYLQYLLEKIRESAASGKRVKL